jgi:outer membrane protein assembly factor BamB
MVPIVAFGIWLWLDRTDPEAASDVPTTPVPSLLVASTSSTIPNAEGTVGIVACADVGNPWVTFQASPTRTGCVPVRTITEPRILWKTEIGVQGWLNNPIIVGDRVVVGSAGRVQFETDGSDGVFALDITTGDVEWFFEAGLDVNGVGFGDGIVVATCDDGRVHGLDVADGREVWSDDLGASAFGNPLVLGEIVVVVDAGGGVTAFDVRTGVRSWRIGMTGPVRGGVASDGETFYAASEGRDVVAISPEGRERWRVRVSGVGSAASNVKVFAAPTIVEGLVIVTLVRDDAYPDPALLALDAATGDLVWRASDTAALKTEWGNVRSSPAILGEVLLYGEPYSSDLVAVGIADGETRWSAEVGPFCYPHWPSPAVAGTQVVLSRHDGGLYAVDATTGGLAWSIYLGDSATAGPFPDTYADSDFCDWAPKTGYSLLASPAISPDGIIVVGSLEGFLYGVGDRSW